MIIIIIVLLLLLIIIIIIASTRTRWGWNNVLQVLPAAGVVPPEAAGAEAAGEEDEILDCPKIAPLTPGEQKKTTSLPM